MDGLVLGINNIGSYKDDINNDFYLPSSEYNEGRTASHEIGHYFNLDHIWGDDEESCTATDHVSDTPYSLKANYGCPNYTNSCNSTGNYTDPETGKDLPDMTENIMDYTNDKCLFIFTEEQVWRMRSVVSGDGCRREMYYAGAQLSNNMTFQPSSQRATQATLSCYDGCPITEDFLDDGYCDCRYVTMYKHE